MRAFLLTFVLTLTACGGNLYSEFPDTEEQPRLVKVTCESGGWGTGFPVAREGRFTVVATAKHVLEGCNLEKGVQYKLHPSADVGLFLLDEKLKPFDLGTPMLGSTVVAYGYPGDPGDGTLHKTSGLVAGTTANGLTRLTAPIWFGFSGGPVLDQYERVVCVNTAIYTYLDGWSMCTPSKYIQELLK